MIPPIERKHHATMGALADVIDDALNSDGPRRLDVAAWIDAEVAA